MSASTSAPEPESNMAELADWRVFTEECVAALLADGSDPDATYVIEHHFAGDDFDALEKVAVDLFKAGFEVTDAEEMETEDGEEVLCFDAIIERPLTLDAIAGDFETLFTIADKQDIVYDGWGTEFIEK